MRTLKNTLNYVLLCIKYNLKSALEYKKSFIIQVLFMIFNDIFFLIYWIVVLSLNGGNLNGIVMKDILLLWAIPNVSWGLANFIFGGLRQLDKLIITGGLDSFILQPKNLLINLAVSKSNFGSFGDFIYGLTLGIIAAESIGQFGLILLFMIFGSIIMMSCFIMVRSLAIWFGDMESIAKVYEQSLLITLSTYPYNIFGNGIKIIMFTIVPAAYIVHIPIKIIMNFNVKFIVLVISATIILALISKFLFDFALKKYESGNNISMKE